MRLLLLAVLVLAAVALGATYEPQGGCDYDFGAGNGTAYLVVNNPYNLTLSLNITSQSGEHKYSEVRNFSNTRVIVFCGLGHGWLYIRQNASQLRSPAWYPLAVPRYVVLRAGESATMFVTTLLAPATTIAAAFLLLVAIKLKPKLKRSAVYALPDTLRGMNIVELASMQLFAIFIIILLTALQVYELSQPPELTFFNITSLSTILPMYIALSLGSFYLSFRGGVWTYLFLLISFLINIYFIINISKSYLLLLFYLILFITVIFTSSVTLLSFYNLFMVFYLSTYGIAVLIYYDENFGHIIPWGFPLQIPGILLAPEILAVIFPAIVVFGIGFVIIVFWAVYSLSMHARAVMSSTVSWPPLWWWFGLGVFAWDELEARSLLHRLSAGGTVVIELAQGERAFVVSADLDGMYLCRFGRRSGVCNNVEWVRYDEVKFKVITINGSKERLDIGRFVRKVALPISIGLIAFFITNYNVFFMINYNNISICNAFIIFMLIFLLYIIYDKCNDLRELEEYIKDTRRKKVFWKHLALHVTWAFMFTLIFFLLTSNWMIWFYVLPAGIVVSFLSWADPKLSRFLFPWLELRLMSVGGLVIALARGGCLRWAKVGVAPQDRDIVIRDEDCEVKVFPYVEQVKGRPQCDLCGPASPPLRIIGGERVAVRVMDGQEEYHYIVDSTTMSGKSVCLFEYLAQIWRRILGMRRGRR
jgi:hypothetical protein